MAITTPGAVDYHLASQNPNRTLSISAANTPVTLMCWINTTGWNRGSRFSMVGTYNGPTTGGTAIQIGASLGNGNVDIWTWGGQVLVSSSGGSGAVPTSGQWTHIAYTYDGSSVHSLYINGIFCNSSTATAQKAGTITAVYINGYPGGGTAETGLFSADEIMYFNHVLSANEILTAYSSSGNSMGLVYGLEASFLFEQIIPGGTVSLCLDYTGGFSDLTPIGSATGVNFTYTTSPFSKNVRPPLG